MYLVGAGPGDPGLLTARALELIARADTILYDRLIPAAALDGARADAELLFVGKQGGGESVPQEHTQALMIERARGRGEVVRLKGGDPFVFGRGGEEALALREAGIPYEIVPGRHRRVWPPQRTRAFPSPTEGCPPRCAGHRAHAGPRHRTSRQSASSTGRRLRRSRGRSCSTWACAGWRISPRH